jgi:hypothetical protein
MATDGGDSLATEPNDTTVNAQSPLLRLPGELRNRIYEYVAEGVKAHVSQRNTIVIPAPLACVNRQIRKEYLEILTATKRPLTATVVDLDFTSLITALCSLDESPCKSTLERNEDGTARIKVQVKFVFETHPDDFAEEGYEDWFEFVDTKYAAGFDISYSCVNTDKGSTACVVGRDLAIRVAYCDVAQASGMFDSFEHDSVFKSRPARLEGWKISRICGYRPGSNQK